MPLRRFFNACGRFFEPEHCRSKAIAFCQTSCHSDPHPLVSTTGRALLLDDELEALDVHSSGLESASAARGFSTSSVAGWSTSLLTKVLEEDGCSTSCAAKFLDEQGRSASLIAKSFEEKLAAPVLGSKPTK